MSNCRAHVLYCSDGSGLYSKKILIEKLNKRGQNLHKVFTIFWYEIVTVIKKLLIGQDVKVIIVSLLILSPIEYMTRITY